MITPVKEKPTREPLGLSVGDEPTVTFVKDPPIEGRFTRRQLATIKWVTTSFIALALGTATYLVLSRRRS